MLKRDPTNRASDERLNRISSDPLFQDTELGEEFLCRPVGFVDVGAAGGVHPMALPIASIVDCLCFDPDPSAFSSIDFATQDSCFHRLTVSNLALNDREDSCLLYLTRSRVNSSLLEPNRIFARRYGVQGFDVTDTLTVKTSTLDIIVSNIQQERQFDAEILKLDCQGSELQILKGATNALANHVVALWCEVEFFELYENQPTFSDIDAFMRSLGFVLYGLYPNYVSAKLLDRTIVDTNERVMWADACYFKDPMASPIRGTGEGRSIYITIISALMLEFFDYACELINNFVKNVSDKRNLLQLTQNLATEMRQRLLQNFHQLNADCLRNPDRQQLYIKRFTDKNCGNNNINHLHLE